MSSNESFLFVGVGMVSMVVIVMYLIGQDR